MRLRLTQRFNLYIGLILLVGLSAVVYHDIESNERLFREIGVSEAERLSGAIFDQLYTSMRLGGGRQENRAIVERFRMVEGVEEVRIIHGAPLDKQFGMEPEEMPRDEFDRAALTGKPMGAITTEGGYRASRFVKPVFIREECIRCHVAAVGEVNGAISVRISLKNYEVIMAEHTRNFLLWGGGILALTSLAVLMLVHKRLLHPLESLKKGSEALAGGDLDYRVGILTGDEFEELGHAFDTMAESLSGAAKGLKELNDKHSKLVEMAADAIFIKDPETKRFIEVNPAATALTGYSREELKSIRPEAIYPPDKLKEYTDAFGRWIVDGRGYLHDAAVIKKDGSMAPVEIAASVLELDGRKYIQEIWRDLSERKWFEDTIKRHVEELEHTVHERTAKLDKSLSELEVAYTKLKDSEQRLIQSAKLISLGEMGAGIAHELNSPLAGILSITEALLKRMPEGDHNYYLLEKIKNAAVRSKYIILDMLTYSRPTREGFGPMFLNESIRATLTLFTSEIKTSSIEIIEAFDPELPKVFGNKGQMMEVILNIIKNARDAMKGSGRIFISTKVSAEEGGEFAVAEIRDTGPGIAMEVRDKIFDPFFTTKEKGGGMNIGLGLSISQSIIKEHGGRIEAGNAEGGGAVFKVYVPLYRQEAL